MRIQRTLPPAAAPISVQDLIHGLTGWVLDKMYLTNVEATLKTYFAVKHVFLVSSGKASLTVILKALKSLAPPGRDQVLIPAYTCFSVPSAIMRAGLKVSLCDIDPVTFDFDARLLEQAVSERTLCIIPDHLFGIPADMGKISAFCMTKGVFLVEDAAQAMGGTYGSAKLGTLGDVGFFSLGRGKNLTAGSGGIILTNSDSIGKAIKQQYDRLDSPSRIKSLQEFLKTLFLSIFIRPSLYWLPAGLSFLRLGETIFCREFPIEKLSGMQAGLLQNWQYRLSNSAEARRKSSRWFINMLCLTDRSVDTPYLRLPVIALSHDTRERLLALARRNGLGLSPMYPAPIDEIDELKGQFRGAAFPVAKDVSQRIFTIPTHQLLTRKDKEKIAALLQPFRSEG